MIEPERIKTLNNKPYIPNGRHVVYWMQASQREHFNHALEYAVDKANVFDKPLTVFFGLTDKYPNANLRHYTFMLEGLAFTHKALAGRGIPFEIRIGPPETEVIKFAMDASIVLTDRGYTRTQINWREKVARELGCQLVQVESDVVVPVETASNKEEYSAATIRRKLEKQRNRFLIPLKKRTLKNNSLSLPALDIQNILLKLKINRTVGSSPVFRGGNDEARSRLRKFIRSRLDNYAITRNNPMTESLSEMSPYLHFGQISPVYIALEVSKANSLSVDPYLEELIVRRELAINFAFYNKDYDNFNCLPDWCKRTLQAHAKDKREVIYNIEELENAATHDKYWNFAQRQMTETGKMHGYLRMYWGKKIIEWSRTPQEAYETALYLNDKYEIDGRDPNGYAGVAWCFGKHDRPWGQRPIFGSIRYMSEGGLKKKFGPLKLPVEM